MKVIPKIYAPLTSDDIQPDPAQYAIDNGLIGNHDDWVRGVVGVWRWEELQPYRERILELIRGSYTIDLGGSAGPLGYGAKVVDYWAEHRGLWDLPPNADVVFASHVLEHFVDIENALATIHDKLRPGGHLIVQVPSYRNEMLRDDFWEWHEQTFCLESDGESFTALDTLLRKWFEIEVCEHGDGKLIIAIARRR